MTSSTDANQLDKNHRRIQIRFGSMVFAPRLWPSVAFLVVFPILCSLGNWQLHRAQEKQQRIDQIVSIKKSNQGKAFSPDQLTELYPKYQLGLNDLNIQVSGQYLQDLTIFHDFRIHNHQVGYHVLNLLKPANDIRDSQSKWILINRGWVPMVNQRRDQLPSISIPKEKMTLSGITNIPDPRVLTLSDDLFLEKNQTILAQKLDIPLLEKKIGVQLAPFVIRLNPQNPDGFIRQWLPSTEIGTSVEKHQGYALQWFTMAAALLIIFVVVNCKRVNNNNA